MLFALLIHRCQQHFCSGRGLLVVALLLSPLLCCAQGKGFGLQ